MKYIKALTFIFLHVLIVQGKVIHVPGEYSTIQQGIIAAIPGDTVLVAEGIYYEQINFLGKKPLLVSSLFLVDNDTNHINRTIIDGKLAFNRERASVVYFTSGEDSTSILCGFTIQHGMGTITSDNMVLRQGGGILIANSGAKIIYNRICQNALDGTQYGYVDGVEGAGIGTLWADGDYWVVIAKNSIENNNCMTQNGYALGGGISSNYNTIISDNIISQNTCSGLSAASAHAGGIGCSRDPSWTSSSNAILKHNIIENNLTQSQNNIANAAGLFFSDVKVLFAENEVNANLVMSGVINGGVSGVYLYQPGDGSTISNNVFKRNSSNRWGGAVGMQNNQDLNNEVLIENNYFLDNTAQSGAALVSFNVQTKLQNNVFSGNHSDKGGAAFFWKGNNRSVENLAVLINNSFSANSATYQGGAVYSLNADPLIINSVFWGDSSAEGPEIYADTVEIAFSDISPDNIYGKEIDGGGNIDKPPLFNDTKLLTDSSANCDASHGTLEFTSQSGERYRIPAYDISGSLRPEGTTVNIGAYEYNDVCYPKSTPSVFSLTCFPNPFTSSIVFEYVLPESMNVKIMIYNNLGELISMPLNENQIPGIHEIEWDAQNLPAGVYYTIMQTGVKNFTSKIIKIQ